MTKTISTSRTTFWLLALGAALLLTFAATTTAARAANGADDPVAHNVGDDNAAQAPAGVVLPTALRRPGGPRRQRRPRAQAGAPPATRTDDPAGHDANDDRLAQRPAVAPTAKKRHHKRIDDRIARHGAVHTAKHHGETGAHA